MDPTIKDFESAIAELESIVKTLEEGDLALEKSLALFERGVQLSRFCHSKLEEAERRIEILNERGEVTAGSSGAGPGGRRRGRPSPVSASSDLHAWLDARRVEVDGRSTRYLPAPPACPPPLATRCATACWPVASGFGRCWRLQRLKPTRSRSSGTRTHGSDAGRVRPRVDSHLLARPRRSAGHGRRHVAARSTDQPRRLRRRPGDSRR